ncbi:sensor histidine kinase [Micromonospora chokoriensis]
MVAGDWVRPVRRRDHRNDLVIAIVLLIAACLTSALFATSVTGTRAATPLVACWIVLMTVPLAWRRRFPGTVAAIAATVFIIGQIARVPDQFVGQIATLLALYTVGAWSADRRMALVIRIVIAAEFALWLGIAISLGALANPAEWSPFPAILTLELLINSVVIGATLIFGEVGWVSARRLAALQARTDELVRERQRNADQAVAIERMRIARELHDVVAHHVSMMGLQAGAARRVLKTAPERSRTALVEVENNARQAIDELKRMLVALRSDDTDELAPSTIGLSRLSSLVAETSRAGTPTTLEVDGDLTRVPAITSLALYRVAQEALTNVRKHGGLGAHAVVGIRISSDEASLRVINSGGLPVEATSGSGLGQIGMRERMAAVGGTLQIRLNSGGYVVSAIAPLRVPTG